MTTPERKAMIAAIRDLPDQLEAISAGLTSEQLTTPYMAGEWSVAQNIHHVADSHMHSVIRCKLILTEDNPTLTPYDQDVWAALPDASDAEIGTSLALIRALHARWVIFWQGLKDADYERTGLHPEIGPVTLQRQLEIYSGHGMGHVDQIRRTLAAGGIQRWVD